MIQDNITGVLIKPHNSSIAIGPGNWIRRNGDALRVEGAVDPNGQLVAATTYSPLINGNALLGTGMGIRVGQFHPAVSNLTINASGNWWDTTSNPTILSRIFDRTDVAPEYQMYYALVNHITALTGATVRPLFNGGYISPAIRTTREYGAGTYHLASPSYVMGGAAVTFEAGAQVLVDAPLSGGSAHAIEAQGGAISVNGTSAQPVTFKSGRVTPAAGDWAGIKVTRDPSTLAAGSMTMTYGDVRHAASGVHFDQTTGSVTQSIIRDNDIGVGVGIKGTPTLGVGNVITANRRGVEIIGDGANVANNPAPVITGASIYLNTQYNAYANTFANAATTTISARDTYWGSSNSVAVEASLFHRPDSPATAPMFDIFGYRDGPGGQPVVALLNVAMQQWTAKPRQTPAPQPAVVQFTLNAPASVTATIVEPPDCAPSTGGGDSCRSYPQCQTVRTLTANYAMAGTYSLSWDGYGEPVGQPPQSQIVSGTAFRIDLLATNGMQSHQVPDLVNRVEIPRPGNANSGWNDVDFDPYANRGITITPPVPAGLSPTTPVLVRTRHELLPNNFTVFHPVVAVSALPATFTWDGRGPDGVIIPTSTHAIICDYAVFPTLVAVSQGLPTLVGQGNGSAPWLEVKADPFALTHSYDQVSSIRYRLNEAASVTIRLLPPGVVPNETNFNSTAAISLIESQARQANTDYAEAYTGFLLQDLNRIRTGDEGQFNFMIRATSNATGAVATYRGALHLSR